MDPAILQRHAAHTHGRLPDGMLERRLELHRMLDDARDARAVWPTLRWPAGVWPRRLIGETVLQDTLIDESTAYLDTVGTHG